MRTPDELTELFRSTGRKVTAQRQCIFRLLQGDETHPSAEAVHAEASREMETISLKTVYQTLHDLVELGEIASLDVGTGMTRFDPNVDDPHHHLVCRQCGEVRDLVADFPDVRFRRGPTSGSRSAQPRSSSAACAPTAGRPRHRRRRARCATGQCTPH